MSFGSAAWAGLAGVVFLALLAFSLVSRREREARAAWVSLLLAVVIPLPLLAAAALSQPFRLAALAAVFVAALAALLVFLLPGRSLPVAGGRPSRRVDERDVLFARGRLRPGSPEFDAYYAMRPENRESDDRFRELPGLLSPDARKAEPVAFASARASFALTEALRDAVDGPVGPVAAAASPAAMSAEVKRLARYFGAREVGIAKLRPYHVYTHIGRGTGTWGAPVVLDHRWAVAFTVEMAREAMRLASHKLPIKCQFVKREGTSAGG